MKKMQNTQEVLNTIFHPRNIAVIGSLHESPMGAHVVIKSLLRAGYAKPIYSVNPSNGSVQGIPAYNSLDDIEAEIDLAVIVNNSGSVPEVLNECGKKGIGAVIVLSDGFTVKNRERFILQDRLLKISKQFGMRIIGPNAAGIVNARNGVNICAYEDDNRIRQGSISILSQRGMVNPQVFPFSTARFGISKICDLGNKCDIDECDMLEYLGQDDTTKVISMYIESVRDSKRFMQLAKRVSSKKPILILKAGRTIEGMKALESYSGSIAEDYKIFSAMCRQSGVLLIDKFSELFDFPKLFASQPLPNGNRMGVITQSGAFGAIAATEALRYGLRLAVLSNQTSEKLDRIYPGLGKLPVDIGPAASAVKDFYRHYPQLVKAVMEDENIDSLLVVLWMGLTPGIMDSYIEAYKALKDRFQKPVLTFVCGSSVTNNDDLARTLEECGFPIISELETTVKAIGLMTDYATIRNEAFKVG